MPEQWQLESSAQIKRRPTHISVASLGTNASGLADSTISFGTISQFPEPPTDIPTELPTPTRTGFGTPTTPRSATSFARGQLPFSAAELAMPRRTGPATPSTPHSVTSSELSSLTHSDQNGYTGSSGAREQVGLPRIVPLNIRRPLPAVPAINPQQLPSPTSSPSTYSPSTFSPSTSKEPASTTKTLLSERVSEKRPASPLSTAAPSMFDWSDAASGISVNPSEERLLTTSFITSLLAQTSEPFPPGGPPTAWGKYTRQLKVPDATSQTSGEDVSISSSLSRVPLIPYKREFDEKSRILHQSVPHSIAPHYPSSYYLPPLSEGQASEVVQMRLAQDSDQRSDNGNESRRGSIDYSETLHSEDQLHSVVRSPSISMGRGLNARAIGVMPAYRISYGAPKQLSDGTNQSLIPSDNSMITAATTLSPLPPVHYADAPQNVGSLDADGNPRESEEDYPKVNSISHDGSRTDFPLSPIVLATAGPQSHFSDGSKAGYTSHNNQLKQALQRNQSKKSVVSSVVSRISRLSTASTGRKARYLAWLKKRPLPPLPPMPRNLPPELPHMDEIQKSEQAIPLPTLAKRAEVLGGMLDDGRLPAGSILTNDYNKGIGVDRILYDNEQDQYPQVTIRILNAGRPNRLFPRFRGHREPVRPETVYSAGQPRYLPPKRGRTRRFHAILGCLLIAGILVIALPIGLVERKKHSDQPSCTGNFTGASCTLDATCVCTSDSGSLCKPLAKALLPLVDEVNGIFTTSFTASQLSDALFFTQGQPNGTNCAQQALLFDVEPNLNSATAPNRTIWAQSAMLWNIGMSESLSAAQLLQQFVSKAPWSSLSGTDGIVNGSPQEFAVVASGYTFNFANQTVLPVADSFEKETRPSSSQLAELSDGDIAVLDQMYSYAKASSTQQSASLQNFWTTTLEQQESDFEKFLANVQGSAFLLPFDATSSPGGLALTSLMQNSTSAVFPPPLACYPNLDSAQLSQLNTLETTVFGLPTVSNTTNFDSSCFTGRPKYGIVDILGLRLPFPDGQSGVALQASALASSSIGRAIIYSGAIVSPFPGDSDVPDTNENTFNPRNFGAQVFLNHVLLNYLSSISNVTLAIALVQHVLSSPFVPPSNNSDLFNSLSSLPVLEFAVFGAITPQDIASSVSSFSTSSNSLFFGSSAAETFRSWALVDSTQSIAWTESAASSQIVRESSTPNADFESVWTPASQLIDAGSTDAADVQKVISSLNSLGLFSS